MTFGQFIGDFVAHRVNSTKPLGWDFHDELIKAGQSHIAAALFTFREDPIVTNTLSDDVLSFAWRVWRGDDR